MHLPLAALLAALFLRGCTSGGPPIARMPDGRSISWVAVDSLNQRLPSSIRLFAIADTSIPLQAWFAEVEVGDPAIVAAAAAARDLRDNRASLSDIALSHDACLAVNGGYFTMDETPARHVGLLVLDDTVRASPTVHALPSGDSLGRAAIGFTGAGGARVVWALSSDTGMVAVAIEDGRVERARSWRPSSAIGAGPMLLQQGEVTVTSEEEGFASTSIPAVHPRTAAGVTADGRLILLVVDGRQDVSRGVDLYELAALLRSTGAVSGLNLDGGGSSTMVAAGILVNRPVGGDVQREVMSAVVVHCGDHP